ncbi:MAG: dihydroorotate dehydrogenase electron transfer subunit [Saccharofermentanales bacterium]
MIKKQILHQCEVLSKTVYSDDIFMLELKSDLIARDALPGQFVNIACDGFLRRPISLCGTDKTKGSFRIAIRVKGSGTAFLKDREAGDLLSVQGPLGNSFDLSGVARCVAVGGGIGIFPLMFLLDEAKAQGIETIAVCGYRSADDSFCTEEIRSKADSTCFSSDSGDMDFCGNAAQALSQIGSLADATVFTCGPAPMMRAAAKYCIENGIRCFASLEERMACGTGVCLVCACKVKAGVEDFEYKRCCCDGPVFAASEVVWE